MNSPSLAPHFVAVWLLQRLRRGSTALKPTGHVSLAPGLGAVPDVGPAAAAAQQRGGGEKSAAGGARGLAEGRKWLEGLDLTLVTSFLEANMVGSTVQHGFYMILQRGTGRNSDFSNRGIEVVVPARRNGFQATTPRISAPKTRDYTTPNKRLSQKHGGLKRWWSQNVNPSSIPRFVANFAGGHFARSKLRGACRCPAS